MKNARVLQGIGNPTPNFTKNLYGKGSDQRQTSNKASDKTRFLERSHNDMGVRTDALASAEADDAGDQDSLTGISPLITLETEDAWPNEEDTFHTWHVPYSSQKQSKIKLRTIASDRAFSTPNASSEIRKRIAHHTSSTTGTMHVASNISTDAPSAFLNRIPTAQNAEREELQALIMQLCNALNDTVKTTKHKLSQANELVFLLKQELSIAETSATQLRGQLVNTSEELLAREQSYAAEKTQQMEEMQTLHEEISSLQQQLTMQNKRTENHSHDHRKVRVSSDHPSDDGVAPSTSGTVFQVGAFLKLSTATTDTGSVAAIEATKGEQKSQNPVKLTERQRAKLLSQKHQSTAPPAKSKAGVTAAPEVSIANASTNIALSTNSPSFEHLKEQLRESEAAKKTVETDLEQCKEMLLTARTDLQTEKELVFHLQNELKEARSYIATLESALGELKI